MTAPLDPPVDCERCPRLAAYRCDNQRAFPDWHNAPVPAFGDCDARLLVVGLAPGLKGANRTGRPFTGDFAGDLLYRTLRDFGLASGTYDARLDDGFRLKNTRVTNAVRCAPPENKPTPKECAACRPFLVSEIAAMPNLAVVLALGQIAHEAVLRALGLRLSAFRFKHGAQHRLDSGLILADSYHCSRYNTNTGKLTEPMFRAVIHAVANRAG